MVKPVSQRSTLQIFALVTLATLCVLSGYWFLLARISSIGADIAILQNDIGTAADRQSRLAAAKIVYDETAVERGKLDQYLIPRDGVAGFIDSIEALQRATGAVVTVVSVHTETPEKKTGTSTERLVLAVNASGTWNEVMHALTLMETIPYQTHLQNVNVFTGGETKKRLPLWNAAITMAVEKLQ